MTYLQGETSTTGNIGRAIRFRTLAEAEAFQQKSPYRTRVIIRPGSWQHGAQFVLQVVSLNR